MAGTAKGDRWSGVGVDGGLLGAHIGTAVERLVHPADIARFATRAVGAGSLVDFGDDRSQRPVTPRAKPDALTGRVAVADRQILCLAIEQQLYGTTRLA